MYFLLNDVILTVDPSVHAPPVDAISLDAVSRLGAELYAANPLLHQTNPERAKRLAALILSKAPEVNAALFVAPSKNCSVAQVACRYAQVSVEIMGALYARQQQGALTTVSADKEVWRRLAA
jgi:hypothetical protein